MIFFLNIIINSFFILLPIILYIVYVCNKQNLNEDENKTILDLALLSPLFLIIMFNNLIHSKINVIFIFIFIIFIISLKYKRNIVSILMVLISIEFIHNYFDINYLLIIIFFTSISLNFLLKAFKYKEHLLFFLISSFLYIIFNALYVLIFIITYLIISYIINRSYKILELQNLLKEYKKESELKVSLFKITHEIKNPLAVIKGYLSMINIDNKEKSIKYLNIISSETERTINLLNDFMQFSKIKIEKSSFELNEILDEVKNILISLTDSKNIELNFKVEKNIIINADYNRLKQVLINIIKNSIEASKNNSNIDITCFINTSLNIIIRDYGIGMDDETLDKIFTPFNTTKEKGTGLGVCLSKEIIEAHKGKITYNSTLNKGTIVKIVLPMN